MTLYGIPVVETRSAPSVYAARAAAEAIGYPVALPPLNMALARELVSRTRIARLLAGYRDRPAADIDAICRVLVAVSQMVIDLPELAELDINPLLVDEAGVIALNGRARVAKQDRARGEARLAIRPYPRELEETFAWDDGEMLMRPIRPDDGERHLDFLGKLDPEDIRMRVFSNRRSIAPSELARLTQIDYEREMAFIATVPGADGLPETIGTVRAVTDADNARAEFGIMVRSDLKGRSLGFLLMKKIIRYCRERGTGELVGDVLRENAGMLKLARALGFEVEAQGEQEFVHIRLPLQAAAPAAGENA
jgi:acetyltransferase